MARFQTETEIYDLWVEDRRLLSLRYAIGDPVPAPTMRTAPSPTDDESEQTAARQAYASLQSQLLRGGWQRVRDPDREVDFLADPPNPALEAALAENPDDAATLAVYTDFLLQHSHPRGELLALEQVIAAARNRAQQHQAELDGDRARRAAIATLLGPLATRRDLVIDWRHGFIHHARLRGQFEPGGAGDALFELVRHPSARFLRELELDPWEEDHQQLVDVLFHVTPPPPLTRIAIHRPRAWEPYYPHLGEFGTLGSIYPQLTDVHINASSETDLGRLALPRARKFALRTANLKRHHLNAVLDAPWPVLEELELRFGKQSDCTPDDLRLLLDGTLELPNLRILRCHAARLVYDILGPLAKNPRAHQLELLDFKDSAFDDNHAEYFLRSREQFPNLVLECAGTRVSGPMFTRLLDADYIDRG